MKTRILTGTNLGMFFSLLVMVGSMTISSCKKDAPDPNLPSMKLVPEMVSGKSGREVQVTLTIHAPYGAKKLEISKTINLVSAFGVTTVVPVSIGDNTYQYVFTYTYQPEEVDKLVGINFHFEDEKGNAVEKDLTVNTIASGAQNIYSHTWKLTSKLWTTHNPIQESLQDCEKDNNTLFKRDSSIVVNYGATGCTFDGFNIFDQWTLSEDEKTFTQVYHSVFDPTKITIEKYDVKSLTKDKLVMEIALDLSVFGLSTHELFLYTYESL
ncbi:MAG: hypothetical protein ABI760_07000 [Ferruginibacter sp.]